MGTAIMGIGSGTGLTMRPTGEALPDGHACCVPVYGHAALWREPAAGTERGDPVLLSGQRCDPGGNGQTSGNYTLLTYMGTEAKAEQQ